ncbi:MAG: protein kinase [Deltaproteobacteria bacterium]|nr:MAG: protein kinase [Deltaproteobacteria bacterium]
MLRVLARAISALLGTILLIAGAYGAAVTWFPDAPVLERARADLERGAALAGARLGVEPDVEQLEVALAGPILGSAVPGAGALLLLFAMISPRTRASAPHSKSRGEGAYEAPKVDRTTRRRVEKQVRALVKQGEYAEAAELYLHAGMLDEAAEHFIRAEAFGRAAEIRHDQNRFEEAGKLHARAGNFDVAGSIHAMQGNHAEAAECYLKIGRTSVAAEMFEKAGQFARAGECYSKAEFHRHAAQVYVRCQKWAEAARALERVLIEETGASSAGKETRKLVLQAAKLYEQAGTLEKAVTILERGQCYAEAADIALKLEHFSQAADLFQRANDPLRAADALKRFGEEQAAARILGEYHRDRGDAAEAAEYLEAAGEYREAGDLYRKLERFAKAGECYERFKEIELAAEMFLLAEDWERAAGNFERAKQFAKAAECCAMLGDHAREGELLEAAGEFLRAGELYKNQELDDVAIKVLQRVESTSPDFLRASSLLGAIFRKKKMYSLSIKKLREALDTTEPSRENIAATYELACVYELNEDVAEAIDLYEKILALDYHYADVEQRLEAARSRRAQGGASGAAVAGSSPDGLPATSTSPGRYQILEELGRGGMGIVYKARDTVLDREVAYKVLPDALKENEQALKNFMREAKSAAQLNHPNIVTVYDTGAQDGNYYIAMEYVEGTTLKEILRRRGVIGPRGVLQVLAQMCEALAYAHGRKIVHRDIKTSNTMWTRDKKAKIMDFGLAKVMEEVRNQTTLVSGTPYYMSPEQTLGHNVDHRTDIYSLGVTLFELATGQLPFREGNVPYHHVHTEAPDPLEINPKLPRELAAIIARCLEKDPDARFQSAADILVEAKALASRQRGSATG